jgi:hypothetical protein
VQSSVSDAGAPQAAVVGIAVSDRFEVVFDTLDSTRKAQNLRRDNRIALVVGSLLPDARQTVQYEGVVNQPTGGDRARLVELYLSVFPDGRERHDWPGITYFRAEPSWLRFSDYSRDPPAILEFSALDLQRLV